MAVLASILQSVKVFTEADFNMQRKTLTDEGGYFTNINQTHETPAFEQCQIIDNRIYTDEIILKNMIIDLKQLEIIVKRSLRLSNCIVLQKMKISESNERMLECIEIDNCIFLQELDLMNIKSAQPELSVYHTNAKAVSLINLDVKNIVIHGCKLFLLSALNLKAKHFEVENNEIRHFEIDDYEFLQTSFEYSQVRMKYFSRRLASRFKSFQLKPYHDLILDMNLFVFKSYGDRPLFREEAQYKTTFSTLNFLKEETDVSKDRNSMNAILFLESFLSQKTFWRKLFIGITGGFMQPLRFVIGGFILIVLYGFLYMLYGLSFADAMYFSGITFTTIGYGEITPDGLARFWAVLEGIVGIMMTSSFLVALVKKYID